MPIAPLPAAVRNISLTRARWVSTGARLAVGGVYTVFGLAKLVDIDTTIRSVRAYQLLPEGIVPSVGTALPLVEIAAGVLLLLGLVTRPAAVVTGLLSLAFFIGVASAWARGLSIECGCFGNGGYTSNPVPGYVRELAINTAMIVASLWLIARPASRFSLDGALRLHHHHESFASPALSDQDGDAHREQELHHD
jgi:uncharacterized membrane protein YphA (DoxX/SURF4 family)